MTQQQCQLCTDLRSRLLTLRGDVLATAVVIGSELEEPTMPRLRLLRVVEARLGSAAQASMGG